MRKVFGRKLWMRVTAVVLAVAINMGALDGVIRYTVQELALGSFGGFLKTAEANTPEAEKNKNSLPETAGPKKPKNPRAEEAKEKNEVIEKRTINAKTYKIGPNEYKTEVYQEAIHYLDENNKLADIDNTLVESKQKGYAFANRANSIKVYFAGSAGENYLGLIQQRDYSIRWGLIKGEDVPGETAGNTITYKGFKANADLKYTIDGSTLKEDIILYSPDAAPEYSFILDLKNLTAKARADGAIEFTDRSGNVRWFMPRPFMYDKGGEKSLAVTAEVENHVGFTVLTVKANEEWLKSTGRQYPVVIDPTLQPGPVEGRDTFISSRFPNTNYRAADYLYVGDTSAYGDTRSFFHFDNLTSEEDITVTSATFSVFAQEGSLSSIRLFPVEANWRWDYSTLTWDFWQRSGGTGALVDTSSGPATGWWDFDVTSLVQQWVDDPASNNGLALSPGSGEGYKEFISCDHGTASKRPKLVYTYIKGDPVAGPANFRLHIDRKTGLIKADGTAVADARVYLTTDDGQSFGTTADSSGKWEQDGMSFEKGKTRTISMYYEYDVERTDEQGNTYIETITSETTSQKFLIAIYSKGARTKKLAKFYYKDGTRAAKLKEDNGIKTELEMVVGDYVLVLDPMRDMPYTAGDIIKDPDEEYRLREKIRPLYSNGEVVGDSIDAATGNFFAFAADLSFDAKGLPVEFTRVLNSQEPEMYRGPLGQNWKLGYDKMLIMYEDGSIEATGGDGGGYFFRPSGSGYVSDADVTERLVKNGDGTYSVITKYNTVYHFDTDGMLDSITDRNGNTITLSYDPEGLLSEVSDAAGRSCKLYYDELGRITLLEDPAGRQVEYVYDSWGRLSEVIDPNGGVTSYDYDPNDAHRVTGVTDPMGYRAVTNEYDSQGRVTTQYDAEGYYVNLSYGGRSTTFRDKNGNEFIYTFDNEYRVTSIDGPDTESLMAFREETQKAQTLRFGAGGRGVTPDPEPVTTTAAPGSIDSEPVTTTSTDLPLVQYRYDERGYRYQAIDAMGYATYYQHDARGNLLAVLNSENKGTIYRYTDPDNRDYPTEVIDAMGNTTRMTYDDNGNVLTVTDPEGNTTSYEYYDSGLVKSVRDPAGKEVAYTYNPNGNVETVKDGRGFITRYHYDEISRLKEVVDPKGNRTTYEYDNNGNLLRELNPAGEIVNSYDYNNRLLGTRDAEGNVTTYRYDKRGYVLEETDPLLKSTLSHYDGNGNLLWTKDANLNKTTYTYDALGRLKKVIEPTGDAVEYFYDPNGNRTAVKDAKGQVTRYNYDKFNRLEKVIDPLQQWAEYTYDDLGNTLFYRDFDGSVTGYKYDALSRVIEVTDNMGHTTRYTYDRSGNQETVTNALNQTYTYRYDENNNLKQVIDPAGNVTEFEYDENNNRIAMKDALGNVTRYEYDNMNRLVRVIDALNRGNEFGLDKNGNRVRVTDGNGHTTHFKYDGANRLRFVIDPKGNTTEYRYDDVGNLRFCIDANGHTTEYRYNSRNLLTHSINPLGQTTVFEYDENGNIVAKTDPNGNRIEYAYDELDRLLGVYYPDGSYVEYGYNDQGKREWMEDMYGTVWYDYDALGRLTAVTNQDDMTVEYEYNALGQKTLVKYPDGKKVKYGYDNLNRLITVTDRLNKVTSYEYDQVGRRTKTILPNGVVTSYGYNTANQLTSMASINADQKLLAKYEYTYDLAGNRTRLIQTVEGSVYTTEYFYDPLNQLEKVINPDGSRVAYEYDPVGNRIKMTKVEGDSINTTKYYYNAANELTKFNVNDGPFTEFRYDNNGNRIAKIEPGNKVTSYTWDYENRLTEVRFHQGKWVGFEYDGDGNRITKLSAMTMPTYKHDNGKGNNPGFTPPGKEKAKKQQSDLIYMLLANGGNGKGNSGGNSGGNGGGNSGGSGKGNSGNAPGQNKNKSGDGKSDKTQNKNLSKEAREKKKEAAKSKGKGYRKKGKYTNKGKHLGWYKNGKIPVGPNGEKVEIAYYLNDVSDPLTQVLMTYGEDGRFDAAYTYGLERIEVEAVDETRPESQDPLYYLYDGLGSVAYMVKPDGNIRDHYRYDEFGNPAPGSKLSEDGRNVLHNTFGYTGEMWDEETNLLYLRARCYEPETGRFLSRDTYEGDLENPLSKNLYAYVENNPIRFIDPSGNSLVDIILQQLAKVKNTVKQNVRHYIWQSGIKYWLKPKGYTVAADFLNYSLQDNPRTRYFWGGSEVVEKIKKSKIYKTTINSIIKNYKTGKYSVYYDKGIEFRKNESSETDLFYAIHISRMVVKGKVYTGKWRLKVWLGDKYDFTEWLTIKNREINIGTLANDGAHISQLLKIIVPYRFYINFEDTVQWVR
ncbi:putative deoxyribonuclease RhsB [Thermincola ferriacetica]|uniref:Putative deoxyribonuclease RhsB n=1 Tax=Thermincola ferriacetica TaxID=281456 RepID=A0A0L6W4D5_9FIRM|nr:DNRLRE domain-containing protein [Thermincola ferriacetica]KNZ70400.1 putative deoxyribonuclease RhsB [Thermincola ferriacetica]